jgi:hypothetical protein
VEIGNPSTNRGTAAGGEGVAPHGWTLLRLETLIRDG